MRGKGAKQILPRRTAVRAAGLFVGAGFICWSSGAAAVAGPLTTQYRVRLRAPSGETAMVTLRASSIPLPGTDEWTADEPQQFGVPGGKVSSWATGDALLSGPAGVRTVVLHGFQRNVAKFDRGNGEKNDEGGSFPTGDFEWVCWDIIR